MFRTIVILVVGNLFLPGFSLGQPSQGTTEYLVNATPPSMLEIGQSCLIFTPDRDRLHFTPFFVLEADDHGPRIELAAPLCNGAPWQVHMYLLVNPEWFLDDVAVEVNEWAARLRDGSPFQWCRQIDRRHLLPVQVESLVVEQSTFGSQNPVFERYELSGFGLPKTIVLTALFNTEDEARRMMKRLDDQSSRIQFRVTCSYYARYTESVSSVRVTAVSLNKTEGMQKLQGAGRPYFAASNLQAKTLQIGDNAVVMTRDQLQRLLQEVTHQIAESYRIEKSADLELLRSRVKDHLEQMFKLQTVDADDVGALCRYLSGYGFDAKDLSPDRIQKLVHEQKDFLRSNDVDHYRKSVGGSVSFLGFGASASHSTNRESIRQRMQDAGWKFGSEGEFWVPKSLEIHIGTAKESQFHRDIGIAVARVQGGEASFTAEVNSFQSAPPQKVQSPLVRHLENLEKEMSKQKDHIDRLEKQIKQLQGPRIGLNRKLVIPTQNKVHGKVWVEIPDVEEAVVCLQAEATSGGLHPEGRGPFYTTHFVPENRDGKDGGWIYVYDAAHNSHNVNVNVHMIVVYPPLSESD